MVRLIRTVTAAAGLLGQCSQAQGHWADWQEASRRNTLTKFTAQLRSLRAWHCSMESQLSEAWHADWIEGGPAACERVLTNAYRVIDLVVDEIKCQRVGIADSIMECLEGSPPSQELGRVSQYLDRQGHAVGSRITLEVFGPCPAGGIGDHGAWPSFRSIA